MDDIKERPALAGTVRHGRRKRFRGLVQKYLRSCMLLRADKSDSPKQSASASLRARIREDVSETTPEETPCDNDHPGYTAVDIPPTTSNNETTSPPVPGITVSDAGAPPLTAESAMAFTPQIGPDSSLVPSSKFFPELGSRYQTRLVTIFPSQHENEVVRCRSNPVALHDDQEYDALSHTWGDDPPCEKIILNGNDFPVRKTLLDAMKALRAKGVRTVWIDNLSINQDDDCEKEQQIKSMHTIYSGAARVYAWIGPRYQARVEKSGNTRHFVGDGEAGLDVLSGNPESGPWAGKDVDAVKAVVSRSYWTRCWIIQELCVAKEAIIMCGSKTVDFNTLSENIAIFLDYNSDSYVDEDVRVHLESLRKFQKQESNKSRNPQMSLIEALLLSRHSKSSRPQDKIYALISLAHDSRKLVSTPNYHQTIETIFWKLAHRMVHDQGHIAIILLARRLRVTRETTDDPFDRRFNQSHHSASLEGLSPSAWRRRSRISSQDIKDFQENHLPLPSWVPMWSALEDDPLPPWIVGAVKLESPAVCAPANCPVHKDTTALGVSGNLLACIESISGFPGIPKYNAHNPKEPTEVASPDADRGFTISRSSTTTFGEIDGSSSKGKRFTDGKDVVWKLWDTILALTDKSEDRDNSPRHTCSDPSCPAKKSRCYAIAKVLLETRKRVVFDWMKTNKTMVISNKTLGDWLREAMAPDNTSHDPPTTKCTFDVEEKLLTEAFELMAKYQMRLAVTSRAAFWLVYCRADVGDHICRIEGCPLPVVLRPQNTGKGSSRAGGLLNEVTERLQAQTNGESQQSCTPNPSTSNPLTSATPLDLTFSTYEYIGEAYLQKYEQETARAFKLKGLKTFNLLIS